MTDIAARTAMGIRWQSATIVRVEPQTDRIKSFFFKLREPFSYRPGQHVDIRLTAEDGYTAMRSYSIASSDDGSGTIELAVERLDDGEVSPFFHDIAHVGDEIEMRGPLGGYFIWTPADGGPVLLVGGGSGVVPLLSMVRYRRSVSSSVPVALLLSARHWNDILARGTARAGTRRFELRSIPRPDPRAATPGR